MLWNHPIMPTLKLCFVFVTIIVGACGDDFMEEIFIKPLPPTHLYAYFQFVTLLKTDDSCKLEFSSSVISI
jgi:hypothetical protein